MIKKHIFLISSMLISVVVYFRWLPFSIFRYSDFTFYFDEHLTSYLKPSIWSSFFDFGSFDISFWKMPINFVSGIFGILKMSSVYSDKFLIFIPIIIGLPLSSFLLTKKITNSNLSALIGSFVFSYNTYFLTINTAGHQYLVMASVMAVFSFYFFISFFKSKNKNFIILSSLTLALSASYDLRITYIASILIFFYYFFVIFLSSTKNYFLSATFSFLTIIFLFILLSSYWLLPIYFSNNLTDNEYLRRTLFGDGFWFLTQSLTLFHPFWNGGLPNWFIRNSIPFYFWLIPLFVLLGLIWNRKNSIIVFFGLVSIFGILLSKQTHVPYGQLYSWLFNNIIGFNAFREPTKFYFLIAISYSVIIAAFTNKLIKYNVNNKIKYLVILIVSSLFLINTLPLLNGNIQSMFVPRRIPNDYLILRKFVLQQSEYYRTLWIPVSRFWSVNSNQNPAVSFEELMKNVNFQSINTNFDFIKRFNYFFDNLYTKNLIDIASIKYIAIPILEDVDYDNFIINYGNNLNAFISKLNKVSYFKKINIGTKELVVYENKGYRPHIYTTLEKETIYKEIPFGNVGFQFRNPTEYKISLKNVYQSTFLNFSETFHPNWKIRVGKFNWFKVLTNKNYFVPDKNHFKNDAQLNSFLIDPSVICKQYECKKNPDGSYDMNLTLFFSPQSYFYLGLIISSLTLFGCILYLIVYFIRSRKTKSS